MTDRLPAIKGKQLIRLLQKDGWEFKRRCTHGVFLIKLLPDGRILVTVVPDKRSPLPAGTLADILGPKQTQLGRHGLAALIKKHGLK